MAAPWRALPSVALAMCAVILTLLSQASVGAPSGRRVRRQPDLFYTSVCEGSTMDLRCPPRNVIYIEDANFGRSDNLTCVTSTIQNQECFSDSARDIVAASCNNRGTCTIPATMQLFGDPCPEEPAKFLEVKLRCRLPTTTTGAPTTPTVPTTRPRVTTTLPRDLTHITEFLGEATTLFPDLDTTTTKVPTTITKLPTTTTKAPTTVPPTTLPPAFCLPEVRRGVQWGHAPSGAIDEQKCPPEYIGFAYWKCVGRPAHWAHHGPDMSGCVSKKVQNITEQLNQGTSVTTISEELVQTVEDEEELGEGDIIQVTNILTASLEHLDEELQNATAEEKTEKTKEVTKNYLKVGSEILGDKNQQSWNELGNETKTETASTLMSSLEESAFLLADTLEGDQTVVEEEENVLMEVVVRGEDDDSDLVFPDSSKLSGEWKGITDSVTLPADSIKERTKDGKTKIVILAYNNIGQLLGVNNGTKTTRGTASPLPPVEKQVARGPCEPKVQERVVDQGEKVNSRVLSVSINDPWETRKLSKPVNLTFQHQESKFNESEPICSFWKFDNSSGDFRSGEWSDGGCLLVHTNETHTICSCDHLTNFAIIMNVKGIVVTDAHKFALSFITYFGFIISIPCLILALITFCIFKNLQSDRTTIHKNLCLTLIVSEVLFVAGIGQTANPVACGVIAMLLHYFFLAAFAWMCLEGIQLYIMLVEVFEAESSRRKYYYPFGYILPLVVVGISAAVDFRSYGTPEYCWICAENNFIWSFVGPVCLIIFGNILFLSMALFIMCKHSSIQTNPKQKTPKEKATVTSESDPLDLQTDSSNTLKSLVRGAAVLLCLLGVTWGFGLLYLNAQLIVFAYIFTFSNSFQGLFIFVFHCCMNDKVCKEYRRYIRNSTWLPECIREQYGGMILTYSNQQNSFRTNSADKRSDSKRFSNTTGSYSIDNRKMSNSSVIRNSGQYDPVRFNSEMTVPEEEESMDLIEPMAMQVVADEGISMDFDPHPVLESTRLDAPDGAAEPQDVASKRLSVGTTEFQPLIIDSDSDNEKHAKLINVRPAEDGASSSPMEMHPLIRESGIGGSSRSGSSSEEEEEDFTPASPVVTTLHDGDGVPTKAHVFANCGPCGMTGSMPDLVNPLTAHARKARMDLVPITCNNVVNNNDSSSSSRTSSNFPSNGYHTLPQTSPSSQKIDLPPPPTVSKTPQTHMKGNMDPNLSPWHKRASRTDDVDSNNDECREDKSLLMPSSPQASNTKSLLETMI